ncbi:MAG: PorV/PorQ family protein [Elusimicrobiota bacterium]|jgi:long-subunit fatty acid transport protein
MRLPLAAFLTALLALPARAVNFDQGAKGMSTGDFLQLGPGARAAGLGEAYSAAADDATALYWNPAAITRIPKRSVTVMHAEYVAESYFDYAAAVQNLGNWGSVGVGAQYFSAGAIPQTDAAGVSMGDFRPYGMAATFGYANTFHDIDLMEDFNGVSIGASAKLVRSAIVDHDSTVAFDVGLLTPEYFERLRAALTVTNLGRGLRFDQEYAPLPLTFRLGTAWKLLPGWMAACDVVFPRHNRIYPNVGTEYSWAANPGLTLSGRAGYNGVAVGDIQGFSSLALGAGAAFHGVSVDYGFLPLGGLGQAHRVSLTFGF